MTACAQFPTQAQRHCAHYTIAVLRSISFSDLFLINGGLVNQGTNTNYPLPQIVRTSAVVGTGEGEKNKVSIGDKSLLEVQKFEFLNFGNFRIPMKKISTSQSEKKKKKLIQNAPKQYLT